MILAFLVVALLPDPVGDSGHWLHPCDVVCQTILPASQAQEEGKGEREGGRGGERREGSLLWQVQWLLR